MNTTIDIEQIKTNAINWLKALKSGEYKQGYKILGDAKVGYCCWGLGCEIVGLNYNSTDGWNGNLGDYMGFEANGIIITDKEIPEDILPYLSIDGNIDLAGLNDSEKFSFDEIADIIIQYADDAFLIPEVSEAVKLEFIKN